MARGRGNHCVVAVRTRPEGGREGNWGRSGAFQETRASSISCPRAGTGDLPPRPPQSVPPVDSPPPAAPGSTACTAHLLFFSSQKRFRGLYLIAVPNSAGFAT